MLAFTTIFVGCENLEDELADANDQIEAQSSELARLRNLLATATADLADANLTITANGVAIDSLTINLSDAEALLAAQSANIEAQSSEIEGLNSQLADLTAAHVSELADLAAAREALAAAVAMGDAIDAATISDLQADVAELEARVRDLVSQIASLRGQVNGLLARLGMLDAQYGEWLPAFTNQEASYVQSTTVTVVSNDGVELSETVTRTLEVSSSVVSESTSTFHIGSDSYDSLEAAKAAVEANASTAVGSSTDIQERIVVVTTTTYSAEGYDSFDVVDTAAAVDGALTAYVKLGDPADTLSDFGPWTAVETPDSQEFLNEERTRTVVTVNGIADTGLVLVETRNDVTTNPNYQAPTDPADVAGAWSYSYVGGSDANWAAGEIDLAGNTLVESISGVRTRVWTINGERDASTPSNLNASNQEVEHKQIRNTSYVAPAGSFSFTNTGGYTPDANNVINVPHDYTAFNINVEHPGLSSIERFIGGSWNPVGGTLSIQFALGRTGTTEYRLRGTEADGDVIELTFSVVVADAPPAPFSAVDISVDNISSIFALRGVVGPSGVVSGATFTASAGGLAPVAGSVDFNAAEEGVYTVYYYTNSTNLGLGTSVDAGALAAPATPYWEIITITVAADGSFTRS